MQACNTFYVASGFRDDAESLISQFQTIETSKFQGFSQLWNAMKFTFVFSGRRSRSELLEFCEEALDIAKEFLSPEKGFKERIGGIYLLYGLYFRMPFQGPKIRMVLKEWENLLELQKELHKGGQYDAMYILQQLMEKNAFAYCLSEQERGLENYYVLKDFMKGNPRPPPSARETNALESILDDIKRQSQKYIQAKENLEKATGLCAPKLFKLTDVFEVDTETTNNENESAELAKTSRYETKSFSRPIEDYERPSTSTDIHSHDPQENLDSSDDSDSSDDFNEEDY